MPDYRIRLVGGEAGEVATISTVTINFGCHISFLYRNRVLEAKASDYFKAFCYVRLQLEQERLIPFCYGASRNVFPSGMCRDMGRGLKAYRMTFGKHATMEDLVNIFDEAADVVPAYVAEQKKYFEDWRKSLRTLQKKQKESF